MNDQELRTLAGDLRGVCMRVSRRARFQNTAVLAPHQLSVLGKLDHAVLTPRQLAEIECVSAPSMTRTTTKLVDLGFVARTDDPDDGRQVHLSVTPAGRSALADMRAQRDEWMYERIKGLTPRECEALAKAAEILGRVVAA